MKRYALPLWAKMGVGKGAFDCYGDEINRLAMVKSVSRTGLSKRKSTKIYGKHS